MYPRRFAQWLATSLLLQEVPLLVKATSIPISATIPFESYGQEIDTQLRCKDLQEYNASQHPDYESNRTIDYHWSADIVLPAETESQTSMDQDPPADIFLLLLAKMVVPSHEAIIHISTNMGLADAKTFCFLHPECVAFTFPLHSTDLVKPDNITFTSAMGDLLSFETVGEEWRTYLVDKEEVASAFAEYIEKGFRHHEARMKEHPNDQTCCTKPPVLPSLAEIVAIDYVERISCDITREEFEAKYEVNRQPVILVGCDEGWPAQERWTYENLVNRFDGDTLWRGHANNSEPVKNDVPWKNFSDAMRNGETFYIFDQLDTPHGKAIEDDYVVPKPFRNANLVKDLQNFPPDYGSMRWWCVGTKYTGTRPHMDPFETDAYNTLVSGYKWWILFPQGAYDGFDIEQIGCDPECSTFTSEMDWYANIGKNALRHHYGAKPAMHILQKAGETIYVPYGMVHSVLNMETSIALTENYSAPGNFEAVWEHVSQAATREQLRLLYLKTFNKAQRAYVRKWYEDSERIAADDEYDRLQVDEGEEEDYSGDEVTEEDVVAEALYASEAHALEEYGVFESKDIEEI